MENQSLVRVHLGKLFPIETLQLMVRVGVRRRGAIYLHVLGRNCETLLAEDGVQIEVTAGKFRPLTSNDPVPLGSSGEVVLARVIEGERREVSLSQIASRSSILAQSLMVA